MGKKHWTVSAACPTRYKRRESLTVVEGDAISAACDREAFASCQDLLAISEIMLTHGEHRRIPAARAYITRIEPKCGTEMM